MSSKGPAVSKARNPRQLRRTTKKKQEEDAEPPTNPSDPTTPADSTDTDTSQPPTPHRRKKTPKQAPESLTHLRRITQDFQALLQTTEPIVLSTPLIFSPASPPSSPPSVIDATASALDPDGDLSADAPLPPPLHHQPLTLPPTLNTPFVAYEERLLQLLTSYDAIDAADLPAIREARKAGIARVQERLHVLDEYQKKEEERWRSEGGVVVRKGEGSAVWNVGLVLVVGAVVVAVLLGLVLDYTLLFDDLRDYLSL
ncbi:hypothetical protein HDV00_000628 [Rhizophlyctis rosea]|nr:hypothetical protein HDV00_000628 [Rhizophlyctis rosea]